MRGEEKRQDGNNWGKGDECRRLGVGCDLGPPLGVLEIARCPCKGDQTPWPICTPFYNVKSQSPTII